MSVITSYDEGEFCWTNLASNNVPGAKKFYSDVFGWTYQDIPMGPKEGAYTICQIGNAAVCAIYPMMEEQAKECEPHWLGYVSVSNVDAAVKKAKAAGAVIEVEPSDKMEAGRMALIQDPTGAHLGLWQARNHKGAGVGEVPGSVCWRELTTPNLDVAAKFYSTLFNWKGSAKDMGNMTYHMLSLGEETVAGMMLPPKKEIPPHWLTYWVVQDCDATIAKAKRSGAQVFVPSTAIPGMGRFAVLADPEGATFGIFETTQG